MSIIIRPITIAGGPLAPATLNAFSDNFDRVNSNYLSSLWVSPYLPTVGRYFHIAANTCEIGNSGGGIDSFFTYITPMLPIGLFTSLTQQASANYAAANQAANIICYAGVGVLLNVSDSGAQNGYTLQHSFDGVNNFIRLRRNDNGGTLLKDNIANYTFGDKITLRAVISADKSTVTLTTFVNDVLVDTTIDSAAGRSTQGLPGIGYLGCEPSRYLRLDNFACSK
jgi:hypothetical protein